MVSDDDGQKSGTSPELHDERNHEDLGRSSNIDLKSSRKFSPIEKNIRDSTSGSSIGRGTMDQFKFREEGHVKNGYDVVEYTVEREDKRLLAVFKLPLLAIAFIVILWSFSVLPTAYTIGTVLGLILLTYLYAWNTIVEETLIVTSTLGIQVQQTNILGRLKYAKYVPIENVKAVVINEIIRRQRVISYLLIVLEATESSGKTMVPLLTGTLPRLRTVEQIYQHVQKVIF